MTIIPCASQTWAALEVASHNRCTASEVYNTYTTCNTMLRGLQQLSAACRSGQVPAASAIRNRTCPAQLARLRCQPAEVAPACSQRLDGPWISPILQVPDSRYTNYPAVFAAAAGGTLISAAALHGQAQCQDGEHVSCGSQVACAPSCIAVILPAHVCALHSAACDSWQLTCRPNGEAFTKTSWTMQRNSGKGCRRRGASQTTADCSQTPCCAS